MWDLRKLVLVIILIYIYNNNLIKFLNIQLYILNKVNFVINASKSNKYENVYLGNCHHKNIFL